ncbi:MAG: 4-hydroxy-tetrahydrodipicolinate synthase [Steroidobacteraceae bacterium]
MSSEALAGTQVAVVTPFRDDGAIDWQAWNRLIDLHLASGTDGLIVGGSTGESAALTDAERRELAAHAASQAAGRLRIVVGCGTSSTAGTVARVREFSRLPGVDGLLLAAPAYCRPPQEGLFRHFEAAAAASAVPVVLYNVPSRTGVDLLPETVARLAVLPRIVAVKEAVTSMSRIRDLIAACPPDFLVLSGDDATAREAVRHGARGVISVTGNVAPAQVAAMMRAALAGHEAEAAELDARLAGLHHTLFVESNPIPVKWALERMGLTRGALRLPLVPMSPRHYAAVEQSLLQAGITLAAAA